MTILMAIGIGLCAEASKHGLDQAKEFMIGLYMVGFGAFAAATEFVYMPNVVKYCVEIKFTARLS